MRIDAININELASAEQRAAATQLKELKQAVDSLIGMTFFDTLLKISEKSALRGEYGHGGRGEEVFTRQLNGRFSQTVAHSGNFTLGDAVFERMIQHPRFAGAVSQLAGLEQ